MKLSREAARRLAVADAQSQVYSAAGKLAIAVRRNRPPDDIRQLRQDLDAARDQLAAVKP